MRIRIQKFILLTWTTLLLALASPSVLGNKMLHRNAEELTNLAARVFVGLCFSVEEKQMAFAETNSSLTYTEYRFRVVDRIKGVQGPMVVLKQLGRSGGSGSITGMPSYRSGERYLLFLRSDSQYGLASPIGLSQGVFLITGNGDGQKMVNGFNNQGLFRGMGPTLKTKYGNIGPKAESLVRSAPKGPISAEQFIELIRGMTR